MGVAPRSGQLPISVVQQPTTPRAAAAEQPSGAQRCQPVSLRDLRVLVVDDDSEVARELAGLVLVNAGRGTHSFSAAEAMAMLEEWLPDVLVTDLEMPEEDGSDVCGDARRATMLRGQRLPVMALNAYGRPEAASGSSPLASI